MPTSKTARRRTATNRRASMRWLHSLRAGGGNRPALLIGEPVQRANRFSRIGKGRQSSKTPARACCYPPRYPKRQSSKSDLDKSLVLLVGAPRFELGTPSPPDWCANRAALRSDRRRDYKFDPDQPQQVQYCGISRLSLAAVPPYIQAARESEG